jgi:hypothetical protein
MSGGVKGLRARSRHACREEGWSQIEGEGIETTEQTIITGE